MAAIGTAALVVLGLAVGAGAAGASSCTSRILVDRYYVYSGTAGGPQQATNAAIWNARAAGHYGSFTRLSTVCG
jgi:hypothetical protein